MDKLIPKDNNNSNNNGKSVLVVLEENLNILNYIISLDKKNKITYLICTNDGGFIYKE